MFDEHARIVVFNHRYIEMYGLSRDIVKPGCTLRELIEHRKAVGLFKGDPKEYCEGIIATIKAGKTASNLIETTDGRIIYAVQQPMAGGGWVVTHEDITERKRAEAQTAFMARHDALTGLANRLHLLEKIEEEFARLRRNGDPFTVFAFDLDLFKAVNDSLGHPTGRRAAQGGRTSGCAPAPASTSIRSRGSAAMNSCWCKAFLSSNVKARSFSPTACSKKSARPMISTAIRSSSAPASALRSRRMMATPPTSC